jgi:hypothetical protein
LKTIVLVEFLSSELLDEDVLEVGRQARRVSGDSHSMRVRRTPSSLPSQPLVRSAAVATFSRKRKKGAKEDPADRSKTILTRSAFAPPIDLSLFRRIMPLLRPINALFRAKNPLLFLRLSPVYLGRNQLKS